MELLDGHLHVHLDLGSGAVKVRASRFALDDGSWHTVRGERAHKLGGLCIKVVLAGRAHAEAQDGQDYHRR